MKFRKIQWFSMVATRDGLGPKSLRDYRFYKGNRDIAEKASIPLKMYLKSLAVLANVLISLKKSKNI
jgi:hypothetical protein